MEAVTQLYYRLFYFLEYQGSLNLVNEYHLFAQQYCFLPRLNSKSMDSFMKSWNNHSLHTEHGHSPNQSFTAGILKSQLSTSRELFDTRVNEETYGVEEDGLVGSENGIAIPDTQVVLTKQQKSTLQRTIDPLSESENHGIDLYEQTLDFLIVQ